METKQLKASLEVSHFYIRDILHFYQFCADREEIQRVRKRSLEKYKLDRPQVSQTVEGRVRSFQKRETSGAFFCIVFIVEEEKLLRDVDSN